MKNGFRRKVKKGSQLGRTIGFPTINLNVRNFGQYYSEGVYVVQVVIDSKKFKGILHFGPKMSQRKLVLEIYLLHFNEMIYGRWLQFFVNKKIREPMRFTDLNDLKSQIQKDIRMA